MNVFINKLAVTLASTPSFDIEIQQVHYTVYVQFCLNCMVMNDNEFKTVK